MEEMWASGCRKQPWPWLNPAGRFAMVNSTRAPRHPQPPRPPVRLELPASAAAELADQLRGLAATVERLLSSLDPQPVEASIEDPDDGLDLDLLAAYGKAGAGVCSY
jgi:hypothetical protein